ncbi:MAG: ABC transporter substrate-binding protein, partial [Balneolaceae bacterium]|nr:ABC transporter substrate-binding protein [Balneolaceae bacterium]
DGENRNYANTPEDLLPYNRFQLPYMHFFDAPLPFRGEGRNRVPPEDLEAVAVGFIGPLDGSPNAEYGREMLNGVQLALEEANERGGYDGMPYKLLIRNDMGLWGATGNEIVELYDQGAWAVVGSINGNNSHVALRVAFKLELPMVNTGTTDPTLTETRIPWMIRTISDDRQNGYALARHIFQERGIENVAVLRSNDRYGRLGVKIFLDSAIRLGHPVRLHLNYELGAEDVEPQLDKIQQSGAEAVLIWGNDRDAATIVNRMRERGMRHAIFGSDRLATERFLEQTGVHSEGVVTVFPYNPDSSDRDYREFLERYRQRFGDKPGVFATHAYDGMNILLQSIETAGLNRARIRDQLTSIETYHGVTGEIIFDTTWNDVGKVWLLEVKEGAFRFLNTP